MALSRPSLLLTIRRPQQRIKELRAAADEHRRSADDLDRRKGGRGE